MSRKPLNLRPWLAACSLLLPLLASAALAPQAEANPPLDRQAGSAPRPLVIGHRGASGHVPEHTLAAYALAILEGADYIELDLVMTRDGQLVSRHDNELGLTTDVARHPEFAERRRTQDIDGQSLTGWFSEDFTLAELKTLRAIERIPAIRPGNARLDGAFEIPTLQEIIDLAKSLQAGRQRPVGLYIETKHPSHFRRLGLGLERPLVEILRRNGYHSRQSPVYIQSFEVGNLKTLSQLTPLRLVQLFDVGQPYDQRLQGSGLTYAQMASPAGLRAIAGYAAGVGPDKSQVIPRDANGNLSRPTTFVADAHAAGLLVHPYTFRAENSFLPGNLRHGQDPAARGDIEAEIRTFLDAGIDGLFIDQPDIAVRLRRQP